MLKGGILGFGGMGRGFAKAVNSRSDAKITTVFDVSKEALKLVEKDFNLKTVKTPEELMKADIDFVIIASTSNAHMEHSLLAAENKKHFICEKPIALELKDADKMVNAVEKAGVVNVVNYTMRFSNMHKKIKDMVDAGALGNILSAWIMRSRGFGLYSGGGRHPAIMETSKSGGWIVHHTCHGLDFLQWICGDIKSVVSKTRTTVPGGKSEEIVWGLLDFESGAMGMIGDSIMNQRYASVGITGDKGTLTIVGTEKGNVLRFRKEEGKEYYSFALPGDIIDIVEEKRPFGLVLDHFFGCIKEGKKSDIDISAARKALAASLALKMSSETNSFVTVKSVK